MGNAQALQPKEGNETFRVTEKLLQDFQKNVILVDNAATGLANAVDAMTYLCKLFQYQHHGNSQSEAIKSDETLEYSVLKTINECILDNKTMMVESVKNFFYFITEICKDHVEFENDPYILLEICNYSGKQLDELSCSQSMLNYLSQSMKNMRKENDDLIERLAEKDQEIEQLIKREKGYISQINQLKLENSKLENELKSDDSMFESIHTNSHGKTVHSESEAGKSISGEKIKVLNPEINTDNPRQKLEKLENRQWFRNLEDITNKNLKSDCVELEMVSMKIRQTSDQSISLTEKVSSDVNLMTPQLILPHKVIDPTPSVHALQKIHTKHQQTIHVQYCQNKLSCASAAAESLLKQVKERLACNKINLIIKKTDRKRVDCDRPLLIACDHFCTSERLRPTAVAKALGNLRVTKNMTVLVFHENDEDKIPIEISNFEEVLNEIGNIIHIGHSVDKLHNSDVNSMAVNDIVDIITATDVGTPV